MEKDIVIPDFPGTIRHGDVYTNFKKDEFVVGRIFFTSEDLFEVEMVNVRKLKVYRQKLSYLEKAIAEKRLTKLPLKVELIQEDPF